MEMAAILIMWPLIFYYKYTPFNLWSLHMKFEFNWRSDFWEKKLLKYIYGTPIWETLAERSKVNLDLWNLFIAIVTLG